MNSSHDHMFENPEVRKALEAKFQEMAPPQAAPEKLKKEVFSTIESLQLVADLADLFTIKFVKSELNLFGLMDEKDEEDPFEEKNIDGNIR